MSNIDLIVTKILDEAEILKFDSNRMFDEANFFTVDNNLSYKISDMVTIYYDKM